MKIFQTDIDLAAISWLIDKITETRFIRIKNDGELKEPAWSHASACGRCHKGWKDCGGGDRTIFGRDFKWLCHSPLMFNDPETRTLENLKKLLLMIR